MSAEPRSAALRVAELEARVAALEELLDVQERTVIEQGERLDQQADELRRSNAELEMFAYVTSHDLQEPLRMVSSYAQLLGDRYRGQLDERADRFIGYMVGGAKRMQRLINDLLTFSRITSRGRELEPTALGPLVDEALTDLELLVRETGAEVTRGELPVAVADPTQVRQLFQNLIANALHHRRPGTAPRVEISAGREESGRWRLTLRDDGPGIDPRHHQRIFQIFQRLDTRRDESTGLGLALCQRIVERHGGRIWVESEAGRGAAFHFTLPAADTVEEEERA